MSIASEKAWAFVGRVGAVVSVLGGLLGLWVFLSAPHEQLRATVTTGPFLLPPSQHDAADELRAAANGGILTTLIAEKPATDLEALEARSAANRVAGHLAKRAQENSQTYQSYEGFVQVALRNHGELAAERVSVRLPFVREAVVVRGDKMISARPEAEVVQIGTIGARSTVTVVGWTMLSPDMYTSDVVVAYSRGLADIVVLDPRPPLTSQLIAIWPFLLGVLLAVFLTVVLVRLSLAPTAAQGQPKVDSSPAEPRVPDA